MNNNFKKILFVGPQYNDQRGGMASVLEVYSKTMDGFKFISTYHNKNPFYNIFYFINAVFKFISLLITDKDIKIIHMHSASRGSFFRKSILILIAKIFRKKTLLHIHGGEFKIFYTNSKPFQFYIRFILNSTNKLVCLSDEWKTYFDSITKKGNCIVLNNPVILPLHISKPTIEKPYKILFLNHINPKKGIFDVLEFFKINQSSMIGNFKLIVAGAGDENILQEFITKNNLGSIIEYIGWISGLQKEELIQDSHLFILTSYNEGLPMSILEAMSFGKPVIATNVGGIPRKVKPNQNGWLVNAGDLEALVPVFDEISLNPELLTAYGNASLQIVKDYSAQKVNETLQHIYADL